MNFYYPTADTFNIEYDEQRRAYVTWNGTRFSVRNVLIDDDWNYGFPVTRAQFELIRLCEPLPTPKPKRSWSRSMGLRRPS